MKKAIGNLMGEAESSFLTKKYDDEKNPTLAKARNYRHQLITEPETNNNDECKLNMAFVKKITGGDIVTCRDLFKSIVSFKPQFTVFLQCNEKPTINDLDESVLRRIQVIPFKYSFKSNPDPLNPFERVRDTSLKNIIDHNFGLEFLKILLEYSKHHKNDKELLIPNECSDATNDYINENNYILTWINNNLTKTNDMSLKENINDRLTVSTLKQIYNNNVDDNQKIKSNAKMMQKLKFNNIQCCISGGSSYLKYYKSADNNFD
jgi:phage/plasmid-associated DNA primase